MNQKKTIVFRADGNSEIGLGHVMRCIALCEMLNGFFQLKFAIQNPSVAIQQLIQGSFSEVLILPETSNYTKDANNLISILSKNDLVVLDGYAFDANYQTIVKSQCHKLIYIDDLVSGHQYADLIINHNGLVQEADYDAGPNTTFLLGTQYALVRKEFFESKKILGRNIDDTTTISVVINMGGADHENISLAILKTLRAKQDLYKITLIIGSANKNVESFESFLSAENLSINMGLSANEMVDVIQACDVAIVSCSTIAYEVSILNKPFVGILTASNQESNAVFFEQNKLALAVLDTKFTAEDLLKSIEYIDAKWNEILHNQMNFFDGKTIERFQHAFLRI